MANLTDNCEFLYHPKIKDHSNEVEQGEQERDDMLLRRRTYQVKARRDWRMSDGSPVGNHNYDRNSLIENPSSANRVTDPAYKIKY